MGEKGWALTAVAVLAFAGMAAAQDLAATYAHVMRPRLAQVATVEDVEFDWSALHFNLSRGRMALAAPADGHITLAIFIGAGELTVSPPNAVERKQVEFFRGNERIQEKFTTAIFRFASEEEFRKALSDQVHFRPLSDEGEFRVPLDERAGLLRDLGRNEAARVMQAMLAPPDFGGKLFYAEMEMTPPVLAKKLPERQWFEAEYDPLRAEPVRVHAWSGKGYCLPYSPDDCGLAQLGFDDTWTEFSPAGFGASPDAWHFDKYKLQVGRNGAIDATVEVTAARDSGSVLFLQPASMHMLQAATADGPVQWVGPAANLKHDGEYQGGWLCLRLPRPLTAGTTTTLKLTYGASPNGAWYPRSGLGPAVQWAKFDLQIEVPPGAQVGAPGVASARTLPNGDRELEWTTPEPVTGFSFVRGAAALGTSAAGRGALSGGSGGLGGRVGQGGMASRAGMEPVIATNSKLEGSSAPDGLPPDDVFMLPTRIPTAAHVVEETANALRFMNAYFGAIPDAKRYVDRGEDWAQGKFSGIHPASNIEAQVADAPGSIRKVAGRDVWQATGVIRIPGNGFLDQTQLHLMSFPWGVVGGGGNPRYAYTTVMAYQEFLPAHEVAHQWWGELVGWATYHDAWLAEGFANASALLFQQSRYGNGDAMGTLKLWREELLQGS